MSDNDKNSKSKGTRNITELSLDDLENVTGAGNPFEDVERVNVKEIDDNLKKKI